MQIRPVEQLVLQGTSFCNLNCVYCDLSEESRRASPRMDIADALSLIRQLVDMDLLAPELSVVWHSGEPLSLPPSYYQQAIDCIKQALEPVGTRLVFDFQTNGTLINEQWCQFFKHNAANIRLGVSCDGPQAMHDAFRLDWRGGSSSQRTAKGLDLLARHDIPFNIIAVVTRQTLADPKAFLLHFRQYQQCLTDFHFNVIASPIGSSGDLGYAGDDRNLFYSFYRQLLHEWHAPDGAAHGLPLRNFAHNIERLAEYGQVAEESFLIEATAPLRSLNMDAFGNVTTFYAGLDRSTQADYFDDKEGFSLGNLRQQALSQMLASAKFAAMQQEFSRCHRSCADNCAYYSVCPGGFELTQLAQSGRAERVNPQTTECIIHVQAQIDAVMDFVEQTERGASGL